MRRDTYYEHVSMEPCKIQALQTASLLGQILHNHASKRARASPARTCTHARVQACTPKLAIKPNVDCKHGVRSWTNKVTACGIRAACVADPLHVASQYHSQRVLASSPWAILPPCQAMRFQPPSTSSSIRRHVPKLLGDDLLVYE